MAYPRATSRPAGGVCSGRALTAGGAVTVVGAGSDTAVRSCPPNRCALQRDRTTVGPTTSYVRAVERPEGKRPTKGSPSPAPVSLTSHTIACGSAQTRTTPDPPPCSIVLVATE
jgi:hypothetical protein